MVLVKRWIAHSFYGSSVDRSTRPHSAVSSRTPFSRGPGKPAGSPWTGSGSEPTVEFGPPPRSGRARERREPQPQLGTIAVLEPRELESLRTTHE